MLGIGGLRGSSPPRVGGLRDWNHALSMAVDFFDQRDSFIVHRLAHIFDRTHTSLHAAGYSREGCPGTELHEIVSCSFRPAASSEFVIDPF